MKDKMIQVLIEQSSGTISRASYDAVHCARGISAGDSERVGLIVASDDPAPLARKLAAETGLDVTALQSAHLASSEALKQALTTLLLERPSKYLCLPHSAAGCDLAPGLALRLGAACITGVESVRREGEEVFFLRPVFKGKFYEEVQTSPQTTVLTVLPGMVKDVRFPASPGEVTVVAAAAGGPGRIRALGRVAAREDDYDLSLAEVIVAAGRGIGALENLPLVEALAALFSRSALGASRALCDLGWLDHKHQVGITGKTVAPKMYLACGISGTAQHLAGMRGSPCIVAINRDPGAPIFRVAHYGIVEDLTTFIPLMLELTEGE
ncbi:MAG: electron transfer flavoprotein subunit alpha/FixB family protein [Smithellaceae bacterium]|nr:electron transfer flavoprotein subunit alpha/FixB family protein [Smithellaceae bacterium]